MAIFFGSRLALLQNESLLNIIRNFTYFSFIIIGILSLIPKKERIDSNENAKNTLMNKIINLKINYTFIVALSIPIPITLK